MTTENNAVLKQKYHSPKSLWGIFRVRNASGIKKPKKYEEDPRTLRAAFPGMITLLNLTNPSPALSGILSRKGRGKRTCGFTLIEMLVVVLIIGILAAIALPQYQNAVERAKIKSIVPLLKAMAQAHDAYYLEHGIYATSFEQLDLKLPSDFTGKTKWYDRADDTRSNKDWALHIQNEGRHITAGRLIGPYKGGGLLITISGPSASAVSVPTFVPMCAERRQEGIIFGKDSKKNPGDFCIKLLGGTDAGISGGIRLYILP